MELNEYFITQCRKLGVHTASQSPSFRPIVSGKKGKNQNGTIATFPFDSFKLNIYYFENGKNGLYQQMLWLSFVLDCDSSIPFSLYDILTVTEPENFKCYTYTFVDSESLMKDCFSEIEILLKRVLPKLNDILENGVTKNKLVIAQKDVMAEYFGGESIFENTDALGGTAEKLIALMITNFFQYQIDSAIIGAQALFYQGKTEKALKKLQKAKYKTLYEKSLLSYLERGGETVVQSNTTELASVSKGAKRHGNSIKGAFIMIATVTVCLIPTSLITLALFGLFTFLLANGNIFVLGIKEAIMPIIVFSYIPSIALASQVLRFFEKRRAEKSNIKHPKESNATKKFYKYLTVFAESVILIVAFIGFNLTIVFGNDSFSYGEGDFPLSKQTCQYSAVDFVLFTDGYYFENEFRESSGMVIITKSGTQIDLSNSTYLSAEENEKELTEFFKSKGITVKHCKTTDEIK